METVSFVDMVDMTADDTRIIVDAFEAHTRAHLPDQLFDMLRSMRGPTFGYRVDRYRHSLQSATRALRNGEGNEMVVAALLHDIGKILTPDDIQLRSYRKRRLVMFGEYIPFEKALPFMKFLSPIGGSFTAGMEPVQFTLQKGGYTIAPLICFEDSFPHGGREHVSVETDLLVNLTNDGWFGTGPEQWQHAANAVFRAVENGVPLVRCANNGLTCWIDSLGRVRQFYGQESGDIYGAGFVSFDVLLDQTIGQTFYNRHGDVFGCCLLYTSPSPRDLSTSRMPSSA